MNNHLRKMENVISSANEPLKNKARFLKKLIRVLLVLIFLDLAFRIISVVAPERINYVAYFPCVLLILLVIPLKYKLKSIEMKLR
jgi:Mg2+/Co2+ transporter CorB